MTARPRNGYWTRNDFRRADRRRVWNPRNPYSYQPPSWPRLLRRSARTKGAEQ
jgi:hypothetical protein